MLHNECSSFVHIRAQRSFLGHANAARLFVVQLLDSLDQAPSESSSMILLAVTLLGLALRAAACAGDKSLHSRDTHARERLEQREYPQVPLTPPSRPLVWGDLNVIHTTDTHGWLLGHQKLSLAEPDYRCVFTKKRLRVYRSTALHPMHSSGDLGDFASFVAHMKQIAIVCPPVWNLQLFCIILSAGKGRRPSVVRLG